MIRAETFTSRTISLQYSPQPARVSAPRWDHTHLQEKDSVRSCCFVKILKYPLKVPLVHQRCGFAVPQ